MQKRISTRSLYIMYMYTKYEIPIKSFVFLVEAGTQRAHHTSPPAYSPLCDALCRRPTPPNEACIASQTYTYTVTCVTAL